MTMHKRLKHLESLVKDVMNSQQVAGPNTPPRDGPEPGDLVARAEALGISSENQRLTIPPSGQVVVGGKETQYVGATHWAAILDDIGEVKEYFDQGEDDDIEEETMPEPSLLFNTDAPPSKAKLLAALPSRRVVDKTVQVYFNGSTPSLRILHAPTFQKEVIIRNSGPIRMTLLFAGWAYYMASCVYVYSPVMRQARKYPDGRASQMQTIRTYRRNCIQCIRLSDYTKPGKYTIEAMLAQLEGEFVLSDADQELVVKLLRSKGKCVGDFGPF
ncbi:hypothetical protein EAF00_008772 [Botryotinia globosa]|nr:hypothetical protein EAF00_008772 [Botryotinia globosa]